MQEANEINTVRFGTPDYIPEKALTAAKQLAERPKKELVEQLKNIILMGSLCNNSLSLCQIPIRLDRDAIELKGIRVTIRGGGELSLIPLFSPIGVLPTNAAVS